MKPFELCSTCQRSEATIGTLCIYCCISGSEKAMEWAAGLFKRDRVAECKPLITEKGEAA